METNSFPLFFNLKNNRFDESLSYKNYFVFLQQISRSFYFV